MRPEIIIMPVLGALIGWVTNRIAIRLLFHPHHPWRIPLIGWELQGLLPKRRADLARTVGETVERELLSAGDLVQYLGQPHFREDLLARLAVVAGERLNSRIPAFVPHRLRDMFLALFQDFMVRECDAVFDQILAGIQKNIEAELSIGSIVENRLLEIALPDLEALILQVAGRELWHIEVLGGILGFLIGLLQAGLVLLLARS